jgi:hypothetical protein
VEGNNLKGIRNFTNIIYLVEIHHESSRPSTPIQEMPKETTPVSARRKNSGVAVIKEVNIGDKIITIYMCV